MIEKEIELLKEHQKKYNFLNEKVLNEMERVDIFCENCSECEASDECPNVNSIGFEGKLLRELHDFFKEAGVDSHLHEFNVLNNDQMEEVVAEAGCVLPLKALLYPKATVSCPVNNFMQIVMKDGHKLLYDVDAVIKKNKKDHMKMYA